MRRRFSNGTLTKHVTSQRSPPKHWPGRSHAGSATRRRRFHGRHRDRARLYYLNNANFNVTALVGKVGTAWADVEHYAYDPYGNVTVYDPTWATVRTSGSSYSNTILFAGSALDPLTGLYQIGTHYYNSAIGRFISRDPTGYAGSPINLYTYCAGQSAEVHRPDGTIPGRLDRADRGRKNCQRSSERASLRIRAGGHREGGGCKRNGTEEVESMMEAAEANQEFAELFDIEAEAEEAAAEEARQAAIDETIDAIAPEVAEAEAAEAAVRKGTVTAAEAATASGAAGGGLVASLAAGAVVHNPIDHAHSHGFNRASITSFNTTAPSPTSTTRQLRYTRTKNARTGGAKDRRRGRRLACQDRGYWWWFKHNLGLA